MARCVLTGVCTTAHRSNPGGIRFHCPHECCDVWCGNSDARSTPRPLHEKEPSLLAGIKRKPDRAPSPAAVSDQCVFHREQRRVCHFETTCCHLLTDPLQQPPLGDFPRVEQIQSRFGNFAGRVLGPQQCFVVEHTHQHQPQQRGATAAALARSIESPGRHKASVAADTGGASCRPQQQDRRASAHTRVVDPRALLFHQFQPGYHRGSHFRRELHHKHSHF